MAGGFGEFLTVLFVNKQLTREATVVRLISVKSESHPSKSHSIFAFCSAWESPVSVLAQERGVSAFGAANDSGNFLNSLILV